MASAGAVGPDLVIAGAARSGTSSLAAHLAAHPDIDPGSMKEPNYFSRFYDRGPQWYDELFGKRTAGTKRLDASTSYTYPQHPDALARLAEASPDAFVVYLVREPVERAVSHYQFFRHYFRLEQAPDFGAALRDGSYYTDVSDYGHWLSKLSSVFPERLLVVPFPAVTTRLSEVASVICARVGLPEFTPADDAVRPHQNQVVEFRAESLRLLRRNVRRNPLWLRLRPVIGAHRIRRVRALFTRTATLPTVEQAVATCDDEQLSRLRVLESSARQAAHVYLTGQDARCGLDWAKHWEQPDSVVDRVAHLRAGAG